MPVVVKDIFNTKLFENSVIKAGQDIDERVVSSVAYVKTADDVNGAEDNCFAVSGGAVMEDKAEFEKILALLEEKEASALCIVKETSKSVSSWLADTAELVKLPVAVISSDSLPSELFADLDSQLIKESALLWKKLDTVKGKFSSLNSPETKIEDIITLLSSAIECGVAFAEVMRDDIYFSNGVTEGFVKAVSSASTEEILSVYKNEPVEIDNVTIGYLIFENTSASVNRKFRNLVVAQTKTSIVFHLHRINLNAETERRFRNEFVQDLISHNIRTEKEVWNRARVFRWDLTGGHFVVIFDIDDYKAQLTLSIEEGKGNFRLDAIKNAISGMVKEHMSTLGLSELPWALFSDSIVYIVPEIFGREGSAERRRLNDVISEIMARAQEKTGFTLTVGVGNIFDSIFDCYKSYEQARQGLELMRSDTGGNVVARWSDMGLYKLLCSVKDKPETREFVSDVIDPLINRKGEPVLFETLIAIIENKWNLRRTADIMGIHYNTVQYRYSKISEILTVDIEDSGDRLKIELATALYRMYQVIDSEF